MKEFINSTMKFLITVLFLSYITIALCAIDCKWSGCEGKFIKGIVICEQQKLGQYTGQTDHKGCKWDTEKVQCCTTTPSKPGCKWGNKCWGTNFDGNYACRTEFGKGYKPTDSLRCVLFQTKYECCPV